MALVGDDDTIFVETPPSRDGDEGAESLSIPEAGIDLDRRIGYIEKRYLEEALRMSQGKMTKAAKFLGLSFRSMRYKVKKYGIRE